MPTKNVAPSRRPERRARSLPSQKADPSSGGFEIVIDGAVDRPFGIPRGKAR